MKGFLGYCLRRFVFAELDACDIIVLSKTGDATVDSFLGASQGSRLMFLLESGLYLGLGLLIMVVSGTGIVNGMIGKGSGFVWKSQVVPFMIFLLAAVTFLYAQANLRWEMRNFGHPKSN